jgi:hypothetical protein
MVSSLRATFAVLLEAMPALIAGACRSVLRDPSSAPRAHELGFDFGRFKAPKRNSQHERQMNGGF